MSSATSRWIVLAAAGGALAASVTVAALPASAVAAPKTSTATTEVTVFLTAPHPAALARLAYAQGLSHNQRVARVDRLVPSNTTHHNVATILRARGLALGSQTAWSINATGATSLISKLFGDRPALPTDATTAEFSAATGPLSSIPNALSGLVSAVYPTTTGPAPFHDSVTSTLDGSDFRNADTPAKVKPSTGKKDKNTTVATLQLASFYGGDDATAPDLVSYAKEHSLANPVADHDYRDVLVDGGPGTSDNATGGDLEVNLDQESILSTAPSADQHAYFAPNTEAAFVGVFASVFDDVVDNKHATRPDKNITALSSSWGGCESSTGAASIKVFEPVLESLVAAGVTTFASAGDDGIYDCGSTTMTGADDTTPDVDFPASSPYVISVGGTNLSAPADKPNTGKNWTESTWTCSDTTTCESSLPATLPGLPSGTGGGGGGESGSAYTSGGFAGFPKPEYQIAAIHNGGYATAKNRMVPDIAADGDPDTGFVEYTSDPPYVAAYGGGSNNVQVGGTSLASPISAAQLDNTLADAGHHYGVGDIHSALYSAYAKTNSLPVSNRRKAFRDVVKGQNGATSQKGIDPSVLAGRGFDTNSGLGGVLWSALKPYLFNTAKPSAKGSLRREKSRKVIARWHGIEGKDHLLLAGISVVIKQVGGKAIFKTTSTHQTGHLVFTAKPGKTYRLQIRTVDISGAKSKVVKRTLVVNHN